MDGRKYAVAEYKNRQTHAKNLKTYIRPIFEPEGGRSLCGRPPFGASDIYHRREQPQCAFACDNSSTYRGKSMDIDSQMWQKLSRVEAQMGQELCAYAYTHKLPPLRKAPIIGETVVSIVRTMSRTIS